MKLFASVEFPNAFTSGDTFHPAINVGHNYQETSTVHEEREENGVIPFGLVHNFGDLEGAHKSGTYTNIATGLDNGASDTKVGGRVVGPLGRDRLRSTYYVIIVVVLFTSCEKVGAMSCLIPRKVPDDAAHAIRDTQHTAPPQARASGRRGK